MIFYEANLFENQFFLKIHLLIIDFKFEELKLFNLLCAKKSFLPKLSVWFFIRPYLLLWASVGCFFKMAREKKVTFELRMTPRAEQHLLTQRRARPFNWWEFAWFLKNIYHFHYFEIFNLILQIPYVKFFQNILLKSTSFNVYIWNFIFKFIKNHF